jgi:hypothetical protein
MGGYNHLSKWFISPQDYVAAFLAPDGETGSLERSDHPAVREAAG